MAIEIKVPTLGESVTEATVAKWFKLPGDAVALDEAVCELETDKVTIEVNSPTAGALKDIVAAEGSDVGVGALLATLDEGAEGAAASAPPPAEEKAEAPAPAAAKEEPKASPPPPPASAAQPAAAQPTPATANRPPLSPAVRKLVDDNDLDASLIKGTGPDDRVIKGDVLKAMEDGSAKRRAVTAPAQSAQSSRGFTPSAELPPRPEDPREERVKMTKLRKVIAGRLKQAQNTAAMLTTWNEVDMGAAMELRSEYKDNFEKKHGVRLGFMSFFVRAAVIALKEWPAINAEIYGEELIYKNFYNVGVAVGTPNGLVVPVLKDADEMRFAEIEGAISDFGRRARDGKLGMDDMMGGTFTISNGGVFGSLNSMPILNVPQSAILGMHKIQKRPMAVGDKVEIRPMMYLALSYDHRIVDGREAVSFLVRMKDLIEDPQRIMLDV
jgi:2-oxoglutarate dehydrogenase E2 component (dihydrolipoamide succinyltransferase)